VGLRYAVSSHLVLGGSYTQIFYVPLTVTSQKQWMSPSAVPFANGSYASHLEFVDANAAVAF
jgi:hypothetical protein